MKEKTMLMIFTISLTLLGLAVLAYAYVQAIELGKILVGVN